MKHDIDQLLQHRGDNPFAVPDDYFASLDSRIMNRLSADKPHIQLHRRIYYYAAAAVATLAIVVSALYINNVYDTSSPSLAAATETEQMQPQTYEDQVADLCLMDNDDIYEYLCCEQQ